MPKKLNLLTRGTTLLELFEIMLIIELSPFDIMLNNFDRIKVIKKHTKLRELMRSKQKKLLLPKCVCFRNTCTAFTFKNPNFYAPTL